MGLVNREGFAVVRGPYRLEALGLRTPQVLPNSDLRSAERTALGGVQALEAFIDLMVGLRNPLGRSRRP